MLVCQQPHYFPWLGYFELFSRTDQFVFLDSVQWTKQGRHHRTKLFGNSPQWLTLPILSKDHRTKTLQDMKVDSSQGWAKAHWKTIQQIYGKAPYFATQVEPLLRPYFEKIQKEEFLIEISQEALWIFWEAFELKSELHWASDLGMMAGKSENLAQICRQLGADTYYSSLGSTRYLDLSVFREHSVRVQWQHFHGYFSVERPADLSVIDWIAYQDFSAIRSALRPQRGFAELSPEL